MAWETGSGRSEIEPSLYAADFAHLGEQIDVLLRTGARVFHFDVGDGHFVEPITIGPIVLQSIAPLIHAVEARAVDCHLMVDNPTQHFPQIAQAGGDSVTFHYEAVDDVPATIAVAREHGLAGRRRVQSRDRPAGRRGGRRRRRHRPLHEHPSRLLGSGVHDGRARADRDAARRCCRTSIHIQVDGGIDNDNVRAVHDAGATLLVAGSAIFGREDLQRAYRQLVQELA